MIEATYNLGVGNTSEKRILRGTDFYLIPLSEEARVRILEI